MLGVKFAIIFLIVCSTFAQAKRKRGPCAKRQRVKCFDKNGVYNNNCDRPRFKHWRIPEGLNMTKKEFVATKGLGYEGLRELREEARQAKARISAFYGKPPGKEEFPELLDDILLTSADIAEMLAEMVLVPSKRNILKNISRLWPSQDVYYEYDGSHSASERAIIETAIDHWEDETCLRFHPSNEKTVNHGYIIFTNTQDGGCWSRAGMVSAGQGQYVNLPSGCVSFGTVTHEIGHAIGLKHQHQRPDRDNYVTVLWDNIQENKEGNFYKQNTATDTFGVPYDYSSIMHYSLSGFGVGGANTLELKHPEFVRNVRQRGFGLTYYDSMVVNFKYCNVINCADVGMIGGCHNSGYPDVNDCDKCRCPWGLTGLKCDVPQSNSQICDKSGVHLVPVPMMQSTCVEVKGSAFKDVTCSWLLKKADTNSAKIQVKFEHFDLQNGGTCNQMFVEIQQNEFDKRGPWYCGEDIPPVTYSDQVLITFHSIADHYDLNAGFKFCFRRDLPIAPGKREADDAS